MNYSLYQKHIRALFFALLCILLWLLPCKMFISPCIMLLGLAWLAAPDYADRWQRIKIHRLGWPAGLLIAYFLLYLVAMFYTDNQAVGWFTLEKKLLFVVAPLLLLTLPDEMITRRRLHYLMWAFIAGCAVVMAASLVSAGVQYSRTGQSACFYYHLVSPFQHPSYMAMYIIFSLAMAVYMVGDQTKHSSRAGVVLLMIYAVPAVIYLMLLQSKSGFLSLVLWGSFWLVYSLMSRSRQMSWLTAYVTLLAVAAFVLIPSAGSRLQNSADELAAGAESNISDAGSTSMRLLVWKEALQIVKEHPLLGVGAGDTQTSLNQRYEAAGMEKARHKELNAHSQIMQTAVAVGLPGLLVFAALFLYPLFACRRSLLLPLWLFFILLAGFNILVESMWETISGVAFFTIFYCLLARYGEMERIRKV